MSQTSHSPARNAALMLADGTVFLGSGIGKPGFALGEICFNTSMTGYQEVLTDPSYTGQIVTFTFPHIGNTGCNEEDHESGMPLPHTAAGLVLREPISTPSSFRAKEHLDTWLKSYDITGIAGIDTRALTRHIRDKGAKNAVIIYKNGTDAAIDKADISEAKSLLHKVPDMAGLELAQSVTTQEIYGWEKPLWLLEGQKTIGKGKYHVIAIDFGEKQNILRNLVSHDCRVTVVPGNTGFDKIMELKPDGVFLSNGPGDPAATGEYTVGTIKKIIAANVPVFGICLGHQILGLALGGTTEKMKQGHRGANHPVKNLKTGQVEITSQNHGFCVNKASLPEGVEVTHTSLFDGCVEGLRLKDKPVFSVQYHPESSPGPHDSLYLFEEFVKMMQQQKKGAA